MIDKTPLRFTIESIATALRIYEDSNREDNPFPRRDRLIIEHEVRESLKRAQLGGCDTLLEDLSALEEDYDYYAKRMHGTIPVTREHISSLIRIVKAFQKHGYANIAQDQSEEAIAEVSELEHTHHLNEHKKRSFFRSTQSGTAALARLKDPESKGSTVISYRDFDIYGEAALLEELKEEHGFKTCSLAVDYSSEPDNIFEYIAFGTTTVYVKVPIYPTVLIHASY